MNNQRRKALSKINQRAEDLHSELEELRDKEQEYIDNMPENLHQGERAEMAEKAVIEMNNAISALEDTTGSLEEAQD